MAFYAGGASPKKCFDLKTKNYNKKMEEPKT
jgi:hypothetical protein